MNTSHGEAANSPARIRLCVVAGLGEGAAVTLSEGQVHYLRNVMRTPPGAPLRLFNGRDGEWLAAIAHLGRDRGEVTVIRRLKAQRPEPGPLLLFAPLKKDAMDFVTAKATELGATVLAPVFTRHSATLRVNAERLHAQAIEAAEQCGRLTVPEVAAAQPLQQALNAWHPDRPLFVAHPGGAAIAAAALFAAAAGGPPPGVLIGPEGGLAEDELDRLAALPFVSLANLGPRILRAETAAVAALACWQAIAGDWNACSDPAEPE